jgi:hypothetical protein
MRGNDIHIYRGSAFDDSLKRSYEHAIYANPFTPLISAGTMKFPRFCAYAEEVK